MIPKYDVNADTEQRFKDFGLVAALVSVGFAIDRTEREQRTMFFIFKDSTELTDAVRNYWSGALEVSARSYFDNTKMLKSLIYGEVSYAAK